MTPHRVTAWGEQTSLSDRKRRAGQHLLVGLPGPALSPELRSVVRALVPAGFVLGRHNAEEALQVRELIRELMALVPARTPALLLAAPLPGGRSWTRDLGGTDWPEPQVLAHRPPSEAREMHVALGRELGFLGFHGLLGPGLDVARPGSAPLVAQASLGATAAAVTDRATQALKGLDEGGILGLPGWYPGLGAATFPEGGLPVVELDRPELEAVDLAPYRALASRAAAFCVGHVGVPAWDEDRPASASPSTLAPLASLPGFRGALVGADLAGPLPGRLEAHLEGACRARVHLHLCTGDGAFLDRVFEALVHLQEEDRVLHRILEDQGPVLERLRLRALRPQGGGDPGAVRGGLGSLEDRILATRLRMGG